MSLQIHYQIGEENSLAVLNEGMSCLKKLVHIWGILCFATALVTFSVSSPQIAPSGRKNRLLEQAERFFFLTKQHIWFGFDFALKCREKNVEEPY